MFSLDRTGNIVTTVALFAVAAVIIYKARGAFFILVLSLFFAYLLEPAVSLVQRYSRLAHKNRTWAITQMYLIGTLVVGGVGYPVGPHLLAQMKASTRIVPASWSGRPVPALRIRLA